MLKKFLNQAVDTAGPAETIDTVMGTGTHFKGVLSFEGSVRIDGKFDGEISTTGSLVIGDGAVVKANVRVGRAVVAGQIHGNITATESLEVLPTGRILGDISTPELQLARGVTLEGKCVINRKADGTVSLNIGEQAAPAAKQTTMRDVSAFKVAQKVG